MADTCTATHATKSCLLVPGENEDVHWANFATASDSLEWLHWPNCVGTSGSLDQLNDSGSVGQLKDSGSVGLLNDSGSVGQVNCVNTNDCLQQRPKNSLERTHRKNFRETNNSLQCLNLEDLQTLAMSNTEQYGSRMRPLHGSVDLEFPQCRGRSRHQDSGDTDSGSAFQNGQSSSSPTRVSCDSAAGTCNTGSSPDALRHSTIHRKQSSHVQKNTQDGFLLVNENDSRSQPFQKTTDLDRCGPVQKKTSHESFGVFSEKEYKHGVCQEQPTDPTGRPRLPAENLSIDSKSGGGNRPDQSPDEEISNNWPSPSLEDLIGDIDPGIVLQTEFRIHGVENISHNSRAEDFEEEEEVNINNHKIPFLSKKKKLNQDLLRLTEQNFCLTSQNKQLRQSIRNVRKSTVAECSKILDTIINYCECKASCGSGPCQMRKSRASSCVNLERVGAGCSTGGCGGYTPSGWNKLQIIHCLQCEDPDCPCCCCPPCSCSEQCPGPCPCCPCPCCPCPCQESKRAPPSRKYKTYNLSCNSKPAGTVRKRIGMPVMSGNVASNKNSPQMRRSRTEQKSGRYTKGLDIEAGHPLKIVKRRRASSAPRWTHNRRQLVYRECCSTVAERLARLEVVDQLEKRRPPVCPHCDDFADGSQNCGGWCREIEPEIREKSARCVRHKIRRVQAFISREADTMRRYFRNVNRKWVVGSTSCLPSGVCEMLRDSEDAVGQKDENFSAVQARPSAKILGELAFQLERRILDYVFGMEGSKRRRFYGYTVNNIYDMMEKESKNYKGDDDPSRKTELMSRLKRLLCGLKKVGYNIKVHGDFAQLVINRYGLLSCPPDSDTIKEFGLQDVKCISSLITQLARGQHEANNLQILLKGLKYLSKCDGGPLFIW